jgi:hypothetical protein
MHCEGTPKPAPTPLSSFFTSWYPCACTIKTQITPLTTAAAAAAEGADGGLAGLEREALRD